MPTDNDHEIAKTICLRTNTNSLTSLALSFEPVEHFSVPDLAPANQVFKIPPQNERGYLFLVIKTIPLLIFREGFLGKKNKNVFVTFCQTQF